MSRNTELANKARRNKRSPRSEKKPLAPPPSVTARTEIGKAIQRRYLTRTEAAGYLGFSLEKLIQHVRAQELPEYDFGPFCKRYRLEDLEAFAEARRRNAFAQSTANVG